MGFFDDKQEWLQEVFAQYPDRRAALMPMLRRVQQEEGWISPERQEEIGQILGITRERVRQIKEKALNRLRHVSRARALHSYTA